MRIGHNIVGKLTGVLTSGGHIAVVGLMLGCAVTLSACGPMDKELDLSATEIDQNPVPTERRSALKNNDNPIDLQTTSSVVTKKQARRIVEDIAAEPSARCRVILARAGVSSSILRSPSITSEISDDKSTNLGIGYDLVDLRRARLTEELAEARCRRQAAFVRLQQLLVTSSQALSRAGYLARARILEKSSKKFDRIERDIKVSLDDGDMTHQRATLLLQYLKQVRAKSASSRGEAAKREIMDRVYERDYKQLDIELADAEREIHRLQTRIRTASALSFKASANYGTTVDDTNGGFVRSITDDGDLTGKLELSVRLGAFSRRRHQLEEIAGEARVAQMYEEESGTLWRVEELRKANSRVLSSLRGQRRDVKEALDKAKINTSGKFVEFDPNQIPSQLRAKIDVIALKAELAALDATIRDTKRIDAKLGFQ